MIILLDLYTIVSEINRESGIDGSKQSALESKRSREIKIKNSGVE